MRFAVIQCGRGDIHRTQGIHLSTSMLGVNCEWTLIRTTVGDIETMDSQASGINTWVIPPSKLPAQELAKG